MDGKAMRGRFDKHGQPVHEKLDATLGTCVTENEYRKFVIACKAYRNTPSEQLRKIFRQWMDTYATGDF